MKVALSGKMAAGKTVSKDFLTYMNPGTQGLLFAEPMKLIESIHANYLPEQWVFQLQQVMLDLVPPDHEMKFPAMQQLLKREALQNDIVKCMMKHEQMPGAKNRPFLQELGTEIGRRHDADLWVNYILNKVHTLEAKGVRYFALDDLRFKNEANALKEDGFILVRINVSPEVQKERLTRLYGEYDPSRFTHSSELDLDDYDDWHIVLDGNEPLQCMLGQLACDLRLVEWNIAAQEAAAAHEEDIE